MISSLASCRSRFPYLTHDHSGAIYCVYGSHITSTLWNWEDRDREQASRIQKWRGSSLSRGRNYFLNFLHHHPFQEDEIIL